MNNENKQVEQIHAGELIKRNWILKSGLIIVGIFSAIIAIILLYEYIWFALYGAFYFDFNSEIIAFALYLIFSIFFPLPTMIMAFVSLHDNRRLNKGLIIGTLVMVVITLVLFIVFSLYIYIPNTLFIISYISVFVTLAGGIMAIIGMNLKHKIINTNKEVIRDYKKKKEVNE